MQGSGFLRVIFFALAAFLIFRFFNDGGKKDAVVHLFPNEPVVVGANRAPYRYCDLWTNEFHATLTSRGATLKSYKLLTAKYTHQGTPIDLSSTPQPGIALGDPAAEDPTKPGEHEFRQQLFVQWRTATVPGRSTVPWNVAYDSVDYDIVQADGHTCEFVYRDDAVELRKTIATTGRPYELLVTNKIVNLAREPRRHSAAIDTVSWWRNADVKAHMFRVSPYVSHVECKLKGEHKPVRLLPDEFEIKHATDPPFQATLPWHWYQVDGVPAFTSISNAYFSQALAPISGPSDPVCDLQIEDRSAGGDAANVNSGHFYRARLAYPEKVLEPGQAETYSVLAYVGPKERQVLAQAGGGSHELSELIDLGFFAKIAKIMVGFLLIVHGVIPSWGLAIIILTLTARMLLFPLMWPGIKNMIRMRELKPEIDALNEKYKDDARAKSVAQMELYRKHNVNLFMGCLPNFATMPVWFALYTTLQTAVELYNIPFLWFPDLSLPDPYFVLPLVIGGTFFAQQKLMPAQGDPAQQKMMMYLMPGMFTVFMLFLPSGLGVYMFTNSVLGILQQQSVEWHTRRTTGIDRQGRSTKVSAKDLTTAKTLVKQHKKAKAASGEQQAEAGKPSESRSLLDKGKA